MRLDKLLANMGLGTRKEVRKIITSGDISVNNVVVKNVGMNVDPEKDHVTYLDDPIHYQEFYYVMLNKPAGIISATEDNYHETVIDWVAMDYGHVDLFPVGRLDIDTTGLLLLTNDGKLAHRLLSPKHHVSKRYQANISGLVTQADIQQFHQGLDLGDFVTLPARLEIVSIDEDKQESEIIVEIEEGKFHQVKRMFHAVGKEVLTLHRIQMGSLHLDSTLQLGDFRELTHQERDKLLEH